MDHFNDNEDNVWGDTPTNPSASVLFNPGDNPYNSIYGTANILVDDAEGQLNEDTLEEVDFKSDPTPGVAPTTVIDELSETMKSISVNDSNDNFFTPNTHTLATNGFQNDEYNHNSQDQAPEDNKRENVDKPELSPELIEQMKQKKKDLLSSLVHNDEEEAGILSKSILSDTPNQDENLFSSVVDKQPEESPLNDVLNLAATEPLSARSSEVDRSISSVSSPNKKTRLLRPRRVKKIAGATPASPPVPTSSTNPLDPLSSKSTDQDQEAPSTNGSESSKQALLNSIDRAPFDIKRKPASTNSNKTPMAKVSSSTKVTSQPSKAIDQFDITVGDPTKVGDLTSSHIVYSITTKTKSKLLKFEETTVTRRYSDFLWLYNQLLNNHPGHIIPPPPEKQAYGRFDEKFIENRRLALEKMLLKISKSEFLQKDYDFIIFLQSEKFSVESKEREFIHYHGDGANHQTMTGAHSASDFSPSSIINKTASSSSSGGFLSSLINLNIPKYVENDQFIIDKQVYIENLDQQLRSLSKTLDFILERREEVMITMNELILVLQQLTELEINRQLSDMFANFSELQEKIKELLERTNLQQILTLGSTIDEYIRTIGSIRNCFEARFKLCNNILNMQSSHSKKQKYLIKFKAKNHNQLDKIKKYEDELAHIENIISKQEEFKTEFNKNLKDDLAKFEGDKVDDFKSMVEIYWEGLVESQKESIELWESFYEKCKFDEIA